MAKRTGHLRRNVIIVAVIVVVVLVAAVVITGGRPRTTAASKYIVHTVKTGTVTSSVSASGQLVDEYTYSVSPGQAATLSQMNGETVGSSGSTSSSVGTTSGSSSGASGSTAYKTSAVYVKVGEKVHRGQKIASATSTSNKKDDLSTAVSDAQASLTNAYSNLASDQSSYSSVKAAKSPSSSKSEINSALKQVNADYVSINSAKSSLKTAQENLDAHSVTVSSPASGYIRSISTAVGASAGDVATIGSGSRRVSVSVSEYSVARVKVGEEVDLTLGAGTTKFTGEVASIAEVSDDSTGVEEYQVVISSDSVPDIAKAGMTVTASIETASRSDVLTVPSSAIITSGGHSVVELVDSKGDLTATRVTLGLIGDDGVEVTAGLKAGDRVAAGVSGTVPVTTQRQGPGGPN